MRNALLHREKKRQIGSSTSNIWNTQQPRNFMSGVSRCSLLIRNLQGSKEKRLKCFVVIFTGIRVTCYFLIKERLQSRLTCTQSQQVNLLSSSKRTSHRTTQDVLNWRSWNGNNKLYCAVLLCICDCMGILKVFSMESRYTDTKSSSIFCAKQKYINLQPHDFSHTLGMQLT